MKTKHHCIAKSCWWWDSQTNITKLKNKPHKLIHELFKVLLPHYCLIFTLKITGKPLTDKVKDDIMEILNKDPSELYKSNTVKDKHKFHKAINRGQWVKRL